MENCNTSAKDCSCGNISQRSMPGHSMRSRSSSNHSMPERSMQERSTCNHSTSDCSMGHTMSHSCDRKHDPLSDMETAMAYVPWQYFRETYEPDKALLYGTIFPELNKPFYAKGGCPR